MSERRAFRVRRQRVRTLAPYVVAAVLGVALLGTIALSLPSGVQVAETAPEASSEEPTVSVEPTSSSPSGSDATSESVTRVEAAAETETPEPRTGITIAWQPSHQGDTGYRGWKEYEICGDIARRVISLLPEYEHILAWETGMGLTGSNNYRPDRGPTNTPAFDSEIAMSNAADATLFVSIHNDGGAPSGVLGECMPGDEPGREACRVLMTHLLAATALPDRGIREVRLYSLESRNGAPIKCLLEIGDNEADRAYLEDPANREVIARGLADGVRALELGSY